MHTILAENKSNIESLITSYKVCYQALLRVSLYRGNEIQKKENLGKGLKIGQLVQIYILIFAFWINLSEFGIHLGCHFIMMREYKFGELQLVRV
jgi:hypothetical protein